MPIGAQACRRSSAGTVFEKPSIQSTMLSGRHCDRATAMPLASDQENSSRCNAHTSGITISPPEVPRLHLVRHDRKLGAWECKELQGGCSRDVSVENEEGDIASRVDICGDSAGEVQGCALLSLHASR